jgi:hypothetical protein
MSEVLTVDQLLANSAEPLRKFRWILALNGIDAYTARSAKRPGDGRFEVTTIDFINEKRFLSGKWTPDTFSLSLWDPIAPSAAQKVQDWIRLNYEITTGRMGYADFYKKDFDLKLLDPPGGVAQQWQVKGAWVAQVDNGLLDYGSSDVVNIDLTIQYDKAILLF